jgi:K+/H+ antiporter YhaU regulatory subunit KhtT
MEQQIDKQIDSSETLRKTIAFAHDDMTITSTPIIPKQKSVIEDIPRQLEESKELNNVLTSEDRQLIVKYLDFVALNRTKRIQLLSDIEHNKKLIDEAERQLLTETNEERKDELRKVVSDSEANIQASKQMLDQIVAYNERQFEDINMRLKSKFTLREKLGYIFKKYGLTLALGLIIDTIVTSVRGTPNITPSPSGNTNLPNKVKQSLKNFSNWLLEMSKKALDNLPAIIGSIISFLLKTTASIVGFLAEHIILFVIALAFALYEALKIGYNDIKRRQ